MGKLHAIAPLIGALLILPAFAQQGTKGNEATASPLQIKLSPPTTAVKVGEPVQVKIEFKNVGTLPIVIETNLSFNGIGSQYSMRAARNGEKLLDPLADARRVANLFGAVPGSARPRELAPQESLLTTIDVGLNFDVAVPGSYKVQLVRNAGQIQSIGAPVPCTGPLAEATSCVEVVPGPANHEHLVRWGRSVSNVATFIVAP